MPNYCAKCGYQIHNPMTDAFCAACGTTLKKIAVIGTNVKMESPKVQVTNPGGEVEDIETRNLRSQSWEPQMIAPESPYRNRSRSDLEVSRIKLENNVEIKKGGYLSKQSNDLLGTWKKRWFQLSYKILFYYANEGDEKALGSIPLKGSAIEIIKNAPKMCFRVMLPNVGRAHTMCASSETEMQEWLDALLEHGSVYYDPKIHTWYPVEIEDNSGTTTPLDITNSEKRASEVPKTDLPPMITRARSSNSIEPSSKKDKAESGFFSFLKKRTSSSKNLILKNDSLIPRKSSSTNNMPCARPALDISSPTLTTKPNPITIEAVASPGLGIRKGKASEEIPRALLFSPSPKARLVRKENKAVCDTCGYAFDNLVKFCGSCGCKIVIEN